VVLLPTKVGIGAFAFGTPADTQANRRIAHAAEVDAHANEARIYTQPDVQIKGYSLSVEYIEEQDGHPSPMLRIARWMVRCCVKDGVVLLILEAAPDHQWRVRRDIGKAIKEINADITVVMSKRLSKFDTDSWYGDSTQPRTQSREAFMKRENKLKKMPWLAYKIIAR
jgi:hypothetical protein